MARADLIAYEVLSEQEVFTSLIYSLSSKLTICRHAKYTTDTAKRVSNSMRPVNKVEVTKIPFPDSSVVVVEVIRSRGGQEC